MKKCEHEKSEDIGGGFGPFAEWCPECGALRMMSAGKWQDWKLPESDPMRVQFTQLANAAACLYADTVQTSGAAQSSRALVNSELERSKPFIS